MNDWYIDRSKNFINDTLDSALGFFDSLSDDDRDSTTITEKIKSARVLGRADGNPNAALTRFRDHGLLKKNNTIGDSAKDYLKGELGKAELIIDMFSKRPAKKTNSPNIKPFFVLCVLFDNMLQMKLDPDDIFITYEECKEYLYPIDSYSDVTFELIEKIISERDFDYNAKMPKPRIKLEPNEDTNLSIWFNALRETPVFMPIGETNRILRPNLKQVEFFRFMAVNADELKPVPTDTNTNLYDYYCNRENGIYEIIPNVIIKNATFDKKEDAQVLFEYLFGYKKKANFAYSKYIRYECFGLFFPFITLPKLVLRCVLLHNSDIGRGLYEFVSSGHGYLETFDENDFEYKGLFGGKKLFGEYQYDSEIRNGNNVVVYGTPGCGKSFYVENTMLENIGVKKDEQHRIRTTFYQDYTNTDFIGQIIPKVKEDKSVTYEFNPGPFALAMKMAIEHSNEPVALVIEELNRGNAASIFGDIFQLLDRDDDGKSQYKITNVNLQDYLNNMFKERNLHFDYIVIPSNLYIVATMNTSDQNVFTLDTAFKRRWKFEKLPNIFAPDHKYAEYFVPGMDGITWKTLVKAINNFIVSRADELSSEDKQLGVYFIGKETLSETKEGTTNETKKKEFAYKLLEYLWDDVAKYNHSDWFGPDVKTLDQLIEEYMTKGQEVFVDGILK